MGDAAVQRHMPRRRNGHTTAVSIDGERFYITANAHEDSTLGEVLIQWGKQGSSSAGLVDIYAIGWSVALQHGVPLVELVRSNLDLYFVPNGCTDDPDIPRARSIADYTARRLAIDWLPPAERAKLGIQTIQETVDAASEWIAQTEAAISAATPADDALRDLRWNLATGLGRLQSSADLTPHPGIDSAATASCPA